jgi:beta-phosphoglucomutase-like phosphatase (HAD superfamily)
MSVVAIIVDMDGLMVDTEPLYKVAWQQAASELGHDLGDARYARLVGRPARD